jgi:hypothetical protein
VTRPKTSTGAGGGVVDTAPCTALAALAALAAFRLLRRRTR